MAMTLEEFVETELDCGHDEPTSEAKELLSQAYIEADALRHTLWETKEHINREWISNAMKSVVKIMDLIEKEVDV
jgi:hypothetical protein